MQPNVHPSSRREVIYISNDMLFALGPYYMRAPSLEFLSNLSSNITALEPYLRDVSELIQMSVVPTQKGDNIISCMTYNPPGPFEVGYDVVRSVSIKNILSLNILTKPKLRRNAKSRRNTDKPILLA